MAIKTALLSVGGTVALLGLMSGPAFAGGPSNCGSPGCDTGVAYIPAPTGHSGPTTIENRTPYDFLDSVHFQRSPHVSITRVHGLAPTIALADAPSGFTSGCHPQSTTYCRSALQAKRPSTLSPAPTYTQTSSTRAPSTLAPSTLAPAPIIQAPVVQAPVMQAPVPVPVPMPMPSRVVAIGGGFDASKFTPRIYGDPYTITPGIAYLPTTVVDRNPYRAQAVLDAGPGGVTPALTGMPMGPLPAPRPYDWSTQQTRTIAPRPAVQPRMMHTPMIQASVIQAPVIRRPMMQAPMMQRPIVQRPMVQSPIVQPSIPTGYPGAAGAPYQMPHGRYASQMGTHGTYWEKASGPTHLGNRAATQVICKRRLQPPTPTPYPAPRPMPPIICNAQAGHQAGYQDGRKSRY